MPQWKIDYAPKWIRIEDALPPENEHVLFALVIDGDNVSMADIGKWTGRKTEYGMLIMEDYYSDDGDLENANLWYPLPTQR